MKKLAHIFLCFSLVIISCFAMVGCKNNPPDTTESFSSAIINQENCSDYFSLNSFLYYQCANSDFQFENIPCYDWCYSSGSINSSFLNQNKIVEDFTEPTLDSFFKNTNTSREKRWKVIEFKALKDIRIKSIELQICKEEDIILNTYNISFTISTLDTKKEYISTSNETNGDICKFTFSSFWYPSYDDISENGYIFIPKDSTITITFNDTNLITETYSQKISEENGSESNEYSTNEQRLFAQNEAKKSFDINNLKITGETK